MRLLAFKSKARVAGLRAVMTSLGFLVGAGTSLAQPGSVAADAGLGVRPNQRVLIAAEGRDSAGTPGGDPRSIYILGPDIEVQHITANGPILLLCGEVRVLKPRIKGAPDPRSEAAVRRLSEEFARGEPNYDLMTPCMATSVRGQLSALRERFRELGPIETMTFDLGGSALGADAYDVYDVEYANGSLTWVIGIDSDDRTEIWMFHDG